MELIKLVGVAHCARSGVLIKRSIVHNHFIYAWNIHKWYSLLVCVYVELMGVGSASNLWAACF